MDNSISTYSLLSFLSFFALEIPLKTNKEVRNEFKKLEEVLKQERSKVVFNKIRKTG